MCPPLQSAKQSYLFEVSGEDLDVDMESERCEQYMVDTYKAWLRESGVVDELR